MEVVPFTPWVALRDERLLPGVLETETLTGEGYKHLVRFRSWRATASTRGGFCETSDAIIFPTARRRSSSC